MSDDDSPKRETSEDEIEKPVKRGRGKRGPGKKIGKKKKKKDPNRPVRAKTPYLIYVQDNRARLKGENPNLSFGEVSRLVGQKWKDLNPEERRPYEEKAAVDKDRYDAEKKKYDDERAMTNGS